MKPQLTPTIQQIYNLVESIPTLKSLTSDIKLGFSYFFKVINHHHYFRIYYSKHFTSFMNVHVNDEENIIEIYNPKFDIKNPQYQDLASYQHLTDYVVSDHLVLEFHLHSSEEILEVLQKCIHLL